VPASPTRSESQEQARIGKGWVYVVVEPWGDVWIDDMPWDRAPVKARLSIGRHVIAVGQDLPTQTRVVNVEAGTRQEIEFILAE
jgi:hypothetical protein